MQITIPLIRGHCGFAIARLFIETIIVMKELASLIRFFFIKLGVIADLPTKKHHKGRIEERRKSTKDDGPRMRLVILFTTSVCKQRTFYMRIPSCFRILRYSHKCNYCPWSERCTANFLSCVVMRRILRPGTSWPMFANSFITVFF